MEAFIRGEGVVAKIDGTDPPISFKAENIRKARTGVHARVEVYAGPHLLGYDLFNIERHADRVRLANACGIKECPKDIMRVYIDGFCALVWPTWVTQFAPEEITPNIDNLEPTQYLLKPYIVEGGGSILFAPGGSGKSYFALLMAQSINQGYGGIWNVRKARVLYVNLERSTLSLEKRLLLVNQVLELPLEAPMLMANARGKTLGHVVEAIGGDFDMVVLDSLSRAGAGSLVDDEAANSVMDVVNGLAATWLVVAHTPRADSTHEFGSVMFANAADLTLSLKSARNQKEELGIQIEGHKANDVPPPKAMTYAMDFDQYGLSGFRTAIASEFPKLSEDEDVDRLEVIRDYLLSVGEASTGQIVDSTGFSQTTVHRAMKVESKWNRRREGKQYLYSVMAQG